MSTRRKIQGQREFRPDLWANELDIPIVFQHNLNMVSTLTEYVFILFKELFSVAWTKTMAEKYILTFKFHRAKADNEQKCQLLYYRKNRTRDL